MQCGPISGFYCAPRLYVLYSPSRFKTFIRLFLNKNCSYVRCSVRRSDIHTAQCDDGYGELTNTPISSRGFLLFFLCGDIYLSVIFIFKTVLLATVTMPYTDPQTYSSHVTAIHALRPVSPTCPTAPGPRPPLPS